MIRKRGKKDMRNLFRIVWLDVNYKKVVSTVSLPSEPQFGNKLKCEDGKVRKVVGIVKTNGDIKNYIVR